MIPLPEPMTKAQARAAGYMKLTHPYALPRERDMMRRAIKQLGPILWVLVKEWPGVEVWRKRS